MPKYTISTVIQKAIYPASQDREAMLDADPDRHDEISKEIIAIEALAGLKFPKMTEEHKHAAMMALTYAEQWEAGLADSQGSKSVFGRQAAWTATLFKRWRHRYFGKNGFEAYQDAADVYEMGGDGQFRNKKGELMQTHDLSTLCARN